MINMCPGPVVTVYHRPPCHRLHINSLSALSTSIIPASVTCMTEGGAECGEAMREGERERRGKGGSARKKERDGCTNKTHDHGHIMALL